MQQAERSAVFVPVVSPAWLTSDSCREAARRFIEGAGAESGRVFVAEYSEAPAPPEFGNLLTYRFWNKDEQGRPYTLAMPLPQPDDIKYYRELNTLATELAGKLTELCKEETFRQNRPATVQQPAVLIVTVAKVEARAVLNTFSKASGKACTRQAIGNKTYYSLGVHGGVPVVMVQSEMGSVTPGGALLTVRQAMQDLHPQAIIMCGIAFGLHPDKQQLGDILIAKQILSYESRKVDILQGQIPRGDRTTVSERLLDRFRSGDINWQNAARTHFGLILSGEKLVNAPDLRDWFLKTEPEAIGGEMEGAGLYAAARDAKADWILVKAICDWADGSKNDDAQGVAANNAAQFVLHVLQAGGWKRSGQNKRSVPNADEIQDTEKLPGNFPSAIRKPRVEPQQRREQQGHWQSAVLVFVNAAPPDHALALEVADIIKNHGMSYALPLAIITAAPPAKVRQDLKQILLNCNVVIVLYDDVSPAWVHQQLLYCHSIHPKRGEPLKALAVHKNARKPGIGIDLVLPNLQVFECPPQELHTYLPEFLASLPS
ncbi:MAG: hypothetical protein GY862_20675 [Gammaproteobacteria bacterium]|nr:hypothetical protein [Gammaproteobacteria bacterium]